MSEKRVNLAVWGEGNYDKDAIIINGREDGEGNIIIYVVNRDGMRDGDGADIFRLNRDSSVDRFKTLNPKYGFDQEDNGMIVLDN